MTEWPRLPLAEIAVVGAGNPAPQKKDLFENGGHPFFRTSDVGKVRQGLISQAVDLLNESGIKGMRRHPAGTILFPKSGASTFLNHRVVMNVDGYVSSHLATIFPNSSKADPRFVFHFLTTIKAQDLLQDANYPSLRLSEISKITVPVPPLPEQQRIVGILDQAFEGIAKAKANADRNLANAKELFESELNTLFEDYPSDWNVSPLGDVCKFVGGSQPPKATFIYEPREGHVRLLQIRDYKSDSKAVYIPKELARRHCEEHDIMIGRYGPPLFQIMRGKSGAYNVALMKALPDTKIIARDFLFYFLRNRNILNYIEETADRTAGQTGFNKERLEAYSIPYPTSDRQLDVVERLQDAEAYSASLAAIYGQKIDSLNLLKASLLHQAFSGNL